MNELETSTRLWAANFVDAQAYFCNECAKQGNDKNEIASDLASAKSFTELAKNLRSGKQLSNAEMIDVLWIIREEFEDLEKQLE